MSRVTICLLWTMFSLLAAISDAHAQDKSDFDAREMFKNFCAPCHGVTGMGDGPVAEALRAQIKPLSTLTERHGGTLAVASGEISVDEGKDVSLLLETHRRTIETAELEERISRLEKAQGK